MKYGGCPYKKEKFGTDTHIQEEYHAKMKAERWVMLQQAKKH